MRVRAAYAQPSQQSQVLNIRLTYIGTSDVRSGLLMVTNGVDLRVVVLIAFVELVSIFQQALSLHLPDLRIFCSFVTGSLYDTMHWTVALVLALTAPSDALIRFQCSQLVTERLDPLVSPGLVPSPHV